MVLQGLNRFDEALEALDACLKRGPESAELQKAESSVKDLDQKITNRVTGILLGLDAKVASLKVGLENLEKEVEKATSVDIEKARQSRPYFDAKRKLEELQRRHQ